MEAFKRQASKLREQVAKQQQAVIKQFGGTGYGSSNVMVIDEAELNRHQQLEKLYKSTRNGRDFQKEIVRAADGFALIGSKHVEIGNKFSDECCKYGLENVDGDRLLAKAASLYGSVRVNVEKEYEDYNKLLSSQISDQLKAMIVGSPLEDARHLAQRYSRMRQEAEAQATEVSRRQSRIREAPIFDNTSKFQASQAKMQELKANMAVLGKEAAAALTAVESQQQRFTLQRLLAMVEAEKSFHLRVATLLDDVEAEMISERQRKESAPPIVSQNRSEKALYFLAEAIHPFTATSEKELSLTIGDYVVVRQVNPTGWSEGECRGKGGWFPSAYVEKRHNIPTNKVFSQAV